MNRPMLACLFAFGSVAACTSDSDGPPAGYQRFESSPIMLQPGMSGQWVQYVSKPLDQDMDVMDIIGTQSIAGHHAILYASPNAQPVGTTREWRASDQITDRFLGGIGGEGAENLKLPEGAIFRVPQGYSLYINTHYYNTGDDPVEGTSRLDVKLEPASQGRLAVGFLGTGDLSATAKANSETELSYSCKTKEDMKFVMWTNHMHEYGMAARTTAKLPSGETVMLKDDPHWNGEWATNPNFTRTTITEPIDIPAGTVLTTSCSWNNPTNHDLGFPDEMCAFIAFHTEWVDRQCAPGS